MPGARLSPILTPPAKRTAPPVLPFISIIVPIRNEEAFIEHLLEQLFNQQYEPDRFEVLVVDGQSIDATRAIVSRWQVRHPNLHLLPNPQRWSSAGRNVAIRAARGEILVVIDGHCHVDNPEYLLELADAFAVSGADCIGRPQPLDIANATPLQRAIAAARSSPLGHHPDSHIYSSTEQFVRPQSVAVAYRRSVFDVVGLFDETFDACEDVDFNHRVEQAGFKCYFTPRVGVRYHPRSTLPGLFRQMARYGRGRVRLLRKFPETFTIPCFLPAVLLLGVVLGALLAGVSPLLMMAYAGGFGLYTLAILVTSVSLVVKKRDGKLLPWLPLVFPIIHFGAGYGILREWVSGWGRSRTSKLPGMIPEQSQ